MSDATPSKTTTPQTAPARQAPATREHEQLSNAAVASGRQHLAGNQAVTGMLQAASEDIPPESVISLQRLAGNQAVQRMLSSHTLQRETLEGRKAEQTTDQSAPPIVYEVLRSPGQPLDTTTRAAMESQLGHDFSRVRIHNDAQAAESAAAVDAHAYTVGHDVVFGPGQYTPQTGQGQETLAHELTHVIQQSNAASSDTLTIGPVDDRYEQEAAAASSAVPVGSVTQPVVGGNSSDSGPDHAYIQRKTKKKKEPEKTEEQKELEEEENVEKLRAGASKKVLEEVEDITSTIGDIVWEDKQMQQPVQFSRNWEAIQSQINNPKPTPQLK